MTIEEFKSFDLEIPVVVLWNNRPAAVVALYSKTGMVEVIVGRVRSKISISEIECVLTREDHPEHFL